MIVITISFLVAYISETLDGQPSATLDGQPRIARHVAETGPKHHLHMGPTNFVHLEQGCKMSQIWQLCLCKNIGRFG